MRVVLLILSVLLSTVSYAEEFYFSSTAGGGTEESRFRSGCAPGAVAIDLRATTGRDVWMCRSASTVGATGVVSLATTTREPISVKTRGDIAAALGKPISAQSTTVADLLRELLVDSGKVRASKDGKLKIYLGDPEPLYQRTAWVPFEDRGYLADAQQLLYAVYRATLEPAVAWAATLATETFTAADGDLSGCSCTHTWSEPVGGGWTIVSNTAQNTTGGGAQLARLDTALATDDFSVKATLVTLSSTGGGFARCGVMGRKDSSSTATYYRLHGEQVGTGWELDKVIAGTATSLGTSTQDPVSSDVMDLRMDGSAISGVVNGITLIGPVTDVDITGNLYGGLYSNKSSTTMTCELDNVIEADISTARRRGPIFFN